jgi:hypothetical protein
MHILGMHGLSDLFYIRYPAGCRIRLAGYPAGYRILKIAGYPVKLNRITISSIKFQKRLLETALLL